MKNRSKRLAISCAVLFGLVNGVSTAQTLEGKAPANGKMMTIQELRSCIKQQEGLKAQREDIQKRRADMDAERAAIAKDAEDIKPLREDVQAKNAQVKAFNEKHKAFGDRVNAFNQKVAEAKDSGRTGVMLEKMMRDISKEERELQAQDAALKAESKGVMDGVQESINRFNARADANQKRALAWNEGNKKLESEEAAYEDKRMDWSANCGGRRYREDDEKAIRAEMK